jgi:MFS family permease
MSLSYNYPPQYAYPSAPPVYRALPAPPRLHWVWVLVLSIVTVGIFWALWMVVQAHWVKKATANVRAFAWSLAYAVFIAGYWLAAIVGSVFIAFRYNPAIYAVFRDTLADLKLAVGFVLYVAAASMLRSALESSPMKIPLHGLGTYFLGPVYFQYYLRCYSVEGKVGEQLSGFESSAEVADAAAAEVAKVPPQA